MADSPISIPDYIQPIVGWRCWAAAWVKGEMRLCSPVYEQVWQPREEAHAECRASTKRWLAIQPPPIHGAPQEGCRCGIYGVDNPSRAVSFVRGQGFVSVPGDVVETVLGKILMWGKVIECDHGWRAEHAYPAELYISARGPYHPFGLNIPSDPYRREAQALLIAKSIAVYGVPVHVSRDDSLAAVAGTLDAVARLSG